MENSQLLVSKSYAIHYVKTKVRRGVAFNFRYTVYVTKIEKPEKYADKTVSLELVTGVHLVTN
jgi:hypothetical protein